MRVLSVSGGGYQGLFAALNLKRFEDEYGPLHDAFDAFVGTSVGGIIAAAAAVGMPMKDVVDVFEREGERIFSSRPPPNGMAATLRDVSRHMWNAKYDGQVLAVFLRTYCRDMKFSDLKKPLMVTATRMRDGAPVLFTPQTHPETLLREAVLASAAAPMILPPVKVDGDLFADGALFANCPDALALEYAVHELGADVRDLRILGMGSMNQSPPLHEPESSNMGIIAWTAKNRIFRTLISAQAAQAERSVRLILGEEYVRIDATPDESQTLVIGLDVATPEARAAIKKASLDVASKLRHAVEHLFPEFYGEGLRP